jgi:hypothetical protein
MIEIVGDFIRLTAPSGLTGENQKATTNCTNFSNYFCVIIETEFRGKGLPNPRIREEEFG